VNTIMLREPLIAARNSGALGLVHVREVITHDPFLAIVGGKGVGLIVKKGEIMRKVNEDKLLGEFVKEVKKFNV
jgi:hypothetical protein